MSAEPRSERVCACGCGRKFIPSAGRGCARMYFSKKCQSKVHKHTEYSRHRDRILVRSRKWHAANRQGVKNYKLLKKYGISLKEYECILQQQEGCCAICGSSTSRGRQDILGFHVDHSHITGRVRGLLCNKCNIGLGFFDDDPNRVLAASMYLQKAEEIHKILSVPGLIPAVAAEAANRSLTFAQAMQQALDGWLDAKKPTTQSQLLVEQAKESTK